VQLAKLSPSQGLRTIRSRRHINAKGALPDFSPLVVCGAAAGSEHALYMRAANLRDGGVRLLFDACNAF
jgi:hypothetical protein